MMQQAMSTLQRVVPAVTRPCTFRNVRRIVRGSRSISRWANALRPRVAPNNVRWVGNLPRVSAAIATSPMYNEERYGVMDSQEVMDNKRQAMVYELEKNNRRAAEEVVPWFLDNMPDDYFKRVPRAMQQKHLQALAGISQTGVPPDLTLVEDDSITVFYPESDKPGVLAELLDRFSRTGFGRTNQSKRKLTSVEVYTSKDGSLTMDILNFADHGQSAEMNDAEHAELFAKVKGSEGTHVTVQVDPQDPTKGVVQVAAANVIKSLALQRTAKYLGMHGVSIVNAVVSSLTDTTNTLGTGNESASVVFMKMEVSFTEKGKALPPLPQMEKELQRVVKWMNDLCFNFAQEHPTISFTDVEIIHALSALQNSRLGLLDPYSFTMTNISQMIRRPQLTQHVASIAALFRARFDPDAPLQGPEYEKQRATLHEAIEKSVSDDKEHQLLAGMLDAVEATLRTNLYLPNRYGLALRLHPSHMGHGTVGTDMPFGVFFVYGRRFKGFHVRFRDIARGGCRVVAPLNPDQHAAESARTFNEAYSLAFAQQLKNKDIPEGGSKAVVLMEPHPSDMVEPDMFGHNFMVRKCVRAFTDGLLDLTIKDPRVVDYYNRDEILYLGPDENIIPQDIDWIIQQGIKRNYNLPQALMSSKPLNGINHKEYGVTSLGVAENLEVALHHLGMHPKDTNKSFSVKLTGGTDGDVAGNMILELAKRFDDKVKVVGMADGTACIEDPDGLNMSELLRMVEDALPLSQFSEAALGPGGSLYLTDKFEGTLKRDTMHNRVPADVFLPCGGRPGTINVRNFREFLTESGEASSTLVVEGANLFITPEARQLLFDEAKVVIVKDSSANKCGVITSSYEILASMLVSPEEFLDMKQELVTDIREQLSRLARVEAESLFNELARDPSVSLPKQSERMSNAVVRLHDAVAETLGKRVAVDAEGKVVDWEQVLVGSGAHALTVGGLLEEVATEHVPHSLLKAVGTTALQALPWPYLRNLIACNLATKVLYTEGLTYVDSLPASEREVADVAFRYVHHSLQVEDLIKQVQGSGIEAADEVTNLLKRVASAASR
mmetsp:Transcript_2723/g.5626  ORF Transcript_2723/g.5626 Transcript_2723/m.5626 type:complete len:1061 (-) Transcript_2723:680-3862(-)